MWRQMLHLILRSNLRWRSATSTTRSSPPPPPPILPLFLLCLHFLNLQMLLDSSPNSPPLLSLCAPSTRLTTTIPPGKAPAAKLAREGFPSNPPGRPRTPREGTICTGWGKRLITWISRLGLGLASLMIFLLGIFSAETVIFFSELGISLVGNWVCGFLPKNENTYPLAESSS